MVWIELSWIPVKTATLTFFRESWQYSTPVVHIFYIKKQIKILDLKNNTYEIKNSMNRVNKKVEMTEEKKISDLEDRNRNYLFWRAERKTDCQKIKESLGICRTISKVLNMNNGSHQRSKEIELKWYWKG